MKIIKKLFKFTFILLLIASIFFNFPLLPKAEEDLVIPRWLVNAEILKNGDLAIAEDITFRFNRDFNGVFREVVLKGTNGIEGIKVSQVLEGKEVEYAQVENAKKGDSNVYMLNHENGAVSIQIFSPSEDEEKTFRLRYTMKNVATRYKDTGELYYQFLGKDNETSIDFFGVNLKLPGNVTERTKIFAHGPTNGTVRFSGESTIRAEVDKLPTNTFVELRILFPPEYIPDSSNVVNKDSYDEIIAEELSYIEEIKEREVRRAKNKDSFNSISLISSTVLASVLFFAFNKYRRRPDIFESLDNSIYPDDNSPAVVSLVLNSALTPSALIATILDLARRGFISIEDLGGLKKKANNFKLTWLNKPIDELLEHEYYLLKWLFNEMGNGKTISTKEIESHRKNEAIEFYKGHTQWTKLVSEEAKKMGYYDNKTKTPGALLLILSVVFFTLSIVSIAFEALYGVLLIILSTIIFIYGIVLLTRKSDYGYIQVKKWRDFKRDLEMRSKSLNTEDLWISLDKALIYGLALGVSFSSLKRFKSLYPESNTPTYWPYWFFLSNSKGENSFADSINKSFNTTASSTGGGGGFSAGGGGGAGGGGAGGF